MEYQLKEISGSFQSRANISIQEGIFLNSLFEKYGQSIENKIMDRLIENILTGVYLRRYFRLIKRARYELKKLFTFEELFVTISLNALTGFQTYQRGKLVKNVNDFIEHPTITVNPSKLDKVDLPRLAETVNTIDFLKLQS